MLVGRYTVTTPCQNWVVAAQIRPETRSLVHAALRTTHQFEHDEPNGYSNIVVEGQQDFIAWMHEGGESKLGTAWFRVYS